MSESPAVYDYRVRKARKQHKCCECSGTIEKGERYFYHHGIWDGEATDFKVCMDCEVLRNEIDNTALYPEDRVAFGSLCEAAQEHSDTAFFKYVRTRRRRSALVPDWMAAKADKVAEALGLSTDPAAASTHG